MKSCYRAHCKPVVMTTRSLDTPCIPFSVEFPFPLHYIQTADGQQMLYNLAIPCRLQSSAVYTLLPIFRYCGYYCDLKQSGTMRLNRNIVKIRYYHFNIQYLNTTSNSIHNWRSKNREPYF